MLGIQAVSQAPFSVLYKGQCVGEYFADILVQGALVVELKCVERLGNEQTAQCMNYLEGFRVERLSAGQLPETQG